MIVNHMELTKEELLDLARPIIEKYTLNPTFKVKALELINEIVEDETLIVDKVDHTIRLYFGNCYNDPNKCLVWYERLSSGWIAALFRGGSVDILEITIVPPRCKECVLTESEETTIPIPDKWCGDGIEEVTIPKGELEE